ncbi:hypothetical protein NPIL_441041 [Nephila pilipes]|uniref:Uncharacterized protein n=1 Tax=Nephila pilipes TaxID=299642 RepID=A0A8X6TRD1_NEPPI|nr:hypothetical protein NPIL_441041 [Nephila pilipes]
MTYKSLKVGKWLHCIYSKDTDTGKKIKKAEFKTPNNEVFPETCLASLYNIMSEKIVKESEDFEDKDSGWTLDEILRLGIHTNRYFLFKGSSSFITSCRSRLLKQRQSSMSSVKMTLNVSNGMFSQLCTPPPTMSTRHQVKLPT